MKYCIRTERKVEKRHVNFLTSNTFIIAISKDKLYKYYNYTNLSNYINKKLLRRIHHKIVYSNKSTLSSDRNRSHNFIKPSMRQIENIFIKWQTPTRIQLNPKPNNTPFSKSIQHLSTETETFPDPKKPKRAQSKKQQKSADRERSQRECTTAAKKSGNASVVVRRRGIRPLLGGPTAL